MPIYEFTCEDCARPFDKLVRSSSAVNEVTCPTCGSRHVTKKMSVFAAQTGGASVTSAASSCAPGGT